MNPFPNSSQRILASWLALLLFGIVPQAEARGMGGRGGGGRAGGGGRSVARPAARPNVNPPSRLPARPPTSSNLPARNPGSALDRSPGISSGPAPIRTTAVRPTPAVRPAALTPLPATLRAGTAPERYAAARATTRTAFAIPRTTRSASLARRTAVASAVRTNVLPRTSILFSPTWWGSRASVWSAHRWHYNHFHNPGYWWRRSAWAALAGWVTYGYTDPWIYDYDDNVVFQDDAVYINEEPIASAEDYIATGKELAQDRPPGDTEEIEWLPLGVFAIATSDSDKTPQMTIQLVISKDGRLSGTYYHWSTQSTRLIHGTVDKETQRVAFQIGDETANVIEVGLAGLTEDTTPMWVHFGTQQTQTWTLIHLDPPESVQKE